MNVEAVRLHKNADLHGNSNDKKKIVFSQMVKVGFGDKERTVWYNYSVWPSKYYMSVLPYWTEGAVLLVYAKLTGTRPASEGKDESHWYDVRDAELRWTPVWEGAPKNNVGGENESPEPDYDDDEDDEYPF